ncbi:MAG: Gfo/Idh/MocA family oxidoreductase [Bacteroidetes bacterium]|nr:Gfo/Idh/MocA family oxidoreductase [Bacteroidota bacterium]MBL6942834.1 Gfo/Idh/MocA family oxidoreductase [Bacteroidales bacterium]
MNSKKENFALIGAAGYIAPRHMKAIKETGNMLIAALDPMDSVGIIDNFFPNTDFFIEPERFDRHLDKLRRSGKGKIDYVSICSPNYLHDAHIRMALRNDAHAICEKPLVLNPWNLDGLEEIEIETGKKIFNILQLRHHPAIIDLKNKIDNMPADHIHDIDLTYITSRGKWYHYSWKGEMSKSGGVVTNIGIHFFDMLGWIFGDVMTNTLHLLKPDKASGLLQLKNANVRWYLSVDKNELPEHAVQHNQPTYRSITVDGEEFEFSGGFTDLHTDSYKNILNNHGFGIADSRNSIEIAHLIRNQKITIGSGEKHPFLKK